MSAGQVDVLAALFHRVATLEADGFAGTAETWGNVYAAVAELIAVAKAIQLEVMEYSPQPPRSADSYLYPELRERLRAALAKVSP